MARRGPAPFTGCGGPDGDWRRGHATSILARLTPECCTKHQSRAKRRRVHLANQLPAMHTSQGENKASQSALCRAAAASSGCEGVGHGHDSLYGDIVGASPCDQSGLSGKEEEKNDCCRRRGWHHTHIHIHIHTHTCSLIWTQGTWAVRVHMHRYHGRG